MKGIVTSLIVFISISLFAQVRNDSLILHYPLTGNVQDFSGNDIHGIIFGSIQDEDRFFNTGEAFYFDGVDDYLVIPDSHQIKVDFPFSVSLWTYIEDFDFSKGFVTLISNCENSSVYTGFSIKYGHDGSLQVMYGDGNGASSGNRYGKVVGVQLNEDQWYHIAVSFNTERDIDCYVNGQKHPGTYTGSAEYMVNSPEHGVIGRNSAPAYTEYHHGIIDDIRLFKDSLSYKDIRYLYYAEECYNYETRYDTIAVTDTLLINTPLGDPLNTLHTVKVYPNPTSEILFIDLGSKYKQMSNYSISITNNSGQVVFTENSPGKVISVNIANYMQPAGLYFLNLYDGNNQLVAVKKIVVK